MKKKKSLPAGWPKGARLPTKKEVAREVRKGDEEITRQIEKLENERKLALAQDKIVFGRY